MSVCVRLRTIWSRWFQTPCTTRCTPVDFIQLYLWHNFIYWSFVYVSADLILSVLDQEVISYRYSSCCCCSSCFCFSCWRDPLQKHISPRKTSKRSHFYRTSSLKTPTRCLQLHWYNEKKTVFIKCPRFIPTSEWIARRPFLRIHQHLMDFRGLC